MQKLFVLIMAILFVSSSVVLAVPAKKTLQFSDSSMGTVTFDGTIHKEAGLKCKECHNSGMFPKMKQGTVKILSLIHISEPTRPPSTSRMPSSA